MAVKRQPPARESSGFVTAQDIDAAEVLHGREILHDDFLASHVDGSMRQCYGRDHRQELRRKAYREGYRE